MHSNHFNHAVGKNMKNNIIRSALWYKILIIDLVNLLTILQFFADIIIRIGQKRTMNVIN